MILFLSALVLIMCFTVDMGVPKRYTPEHDAAYYTSSPETMQELVAELEEAEFSRLEGVMDCTVNPDGRTVRITIDAEHYGAVTSVLNRDFGEELFDFRSWEG